MPYHPQPGMSIDELDTPSLIVDLDLFNKNIQFMSEFFRDKPVNLRPHCKTHKSVEIAKRQLEAGANGITCAKVSEAEVFAANGIKNILIANQIVGAVKIDRLTDLANQCDLIVAVDSAQNILDLQTAAEKKSVHLGVLIEIEIGMGRCGVADGETIVRLAQLVMNSRNLQFMGLQAYEGHLVLTPDKTERELKVRAAMQKVADNYDLLIHSGIPVEIVSGGGTGTFDITSECYPFNEIQAGSYVFMDSTYKNIQPVFKNALYVLSSIVSRPSSDRLITDIGLKSVTKEFGWPQLLNINGAEFQYLSEEHGVMKLISPDQVSCKAGDRVKYLPSHCCTTVNLHDFIYIIQGEKLVDIWQINARGCSQ